MALLCVPVAVLLTAVAGALPALRAAGTRSAEALWADVVPARRSAVRLTFAGLAVVNLVRAPAFDIARPSRVETGVRISVALGDHFVVGAS